MAERVLSQTELIRPWQPDEIAGGLARHITVPEHQIAIVRRNGTSTVLSGPGRYRVLGVGAALLGREAPPVWSLVAGPFTLHSFIGELLSQDGVMVEADLLLQVRTDKPERFFQAHGASLRPTSQGQVAAALAQELHSIFSALTKQYTLDGLVHTVLAVEEARRQVLGAIRIILQGWGLELLGLVHLGFHRALDAVELARLGMETRQKLSEISLQEQINQMEHRQILAYARAEFGLTEAEQSEMDLRTDYQNAQEAIYQVLTERLARLEAKASQQLTALVKDLPEDSFPPFDSAAQPAVPSLEKNADRHLEDLVAFLRLLGAGISLIMALTAPYLSFLIRDGKTPTIWAASIGFFLACAAFITSSLIRRYLRIHRRRAIAEAACAQEQAIRLARLSQERRMRRYLEQRLRQVSANCQQAWQRVWEQDADLAIQMRRVCSKTYERLANKVQEAGCPSSEAQRLSQLQAEELTRLLLLTQGVLSHAESMVSLSADVCRSAMTGDLNGIRQAVYRLDEGRLIIENKFAERERFLGA